MRNLGWTLRSTVLAATVMMVSIGPAQGGVIFNFTGATLGGGLRWDAAARTINIGGTNYERSLDGGLRYSMQGGSFQAYRDLFAWSGAAPSVADFTQAVMDAFNAWTIPDPVSGLTTAVTFVADLATPVGGAEIELFGRDSGNSGLRAATSISFVVDSMVTLTSGTVNYASWAISGADIVINSNANARYTLDVFRRNLTHEIGHAIGLGDVEGNISPGRFIDDNFDGTNSATALATLTNSWALLVNPLNPGASVGLNRYTVPFGNPGTTTPGVDILMESIGAGIDAGNPVTNLFPLTNDDFGTRQFLYPSLAAVPEPSTTVFVGTAIVSIFSLRRRKSL